MSISRIELVPGWQPDVNLVKYNGNGKGVTFLARVARYFFGFVGLIGGFFWGLRLPDFLAQVLAYDPTVLSRGALLLFGAVFGGAFGFFIGPFLVSRVVQFVAWVQARLFRIPAQDTLAGAFGLIIGLLISYLLRPALSSLPLVGSYLPTGASLLLGYLGWVVAVHKREDLWGVLQLLAKAGGKERGEPGEAGGNYKVLDTSAIIDGRIMDVARAGFIDGTLVVPSFVLDELRHIADSTDALRRNRGRHGLDILNKMQKDLDMPIMVYDRDQVSGSAEVDVKLVTLAKKLKAKIVTTDLNLNKVAGLHGVPVLNVNELSNALKPHVLPGEEMTVQVIRDGKEPGQGVGYLDDGTMIVVDSGKRFMGEFVGVEVTSILQTTAGRMIFAKPKHQPGEVRASTST